MFVRACAVIIAVMFCVPSHGSVDFGNLPIHFEHRSLRVLKRDEAVSIRACSLTRNTILEQHTGDSAGREPVTCFAAFQIHGDDGVAAAGKDDDGSAGVVGLG